MKCMAGIVRLLMPYMPEPHCSYFSCCQRMDYLYQFMNESWTRNSEVFYALGKVGLINVKCDWPRYTDLRDFTQM